MRGRAERTSLKTAATYNDTIPKEPRTTNATITIMHVCECCIVEADCIILKVLCVVAVAPFT